jgi:RHS repeat-associated protein
MFVEQISTGGTITYLHHDQQGSTRLLTGSTGTVTGSTTFDAYGNKTGSTGTSTTPLGYDAEYTSSDTGLIYLRARVYDPATAQFLSRDPLVPLTREPYAYGGDNPTSFSDPTGLLTFGICVNWEVALGIRVGVGGCVQGSTSGEVGVSGTVSGGVASGAGVSVGGGIQSSSAQHIEELGGPFAHLGGSIHAGPGMSADTFYGANPCGNAITGGEVSVGIGGGADQYVSGSETETLATGF